MEKRRRPPAVLLFWTRLHSPYCSIPSSVLREICSYFPLPQLLFYLSRESIRQYDFLRSCWRPASVLSEALPDRIPSYCPIDHLHVLSCGGFSTIHTGHKKGYVTTDTVTIIDRHIGRVQHLSSLSTSRAYHGVICCEGAVYVFGGVHRDEYAPKSKGLKSAEVFHVQQKVWEALPDMSEARSYLAACIWQGLIYLSGSLSPSLEAFHPVSKTYTLLPLSLPLDFDAVLFPSFDNLVLLSATHISTITLTAAGHYKAVSDEHEKVTCWCRCPAVVWGGLVYLVQEERTAVLDAEKGGRVSVALKRG